MGVAQVRADGSAGTVVQSLATGRSSPETARSVVWVGRRGIQELLYLMRRRWGGKRHPGGWVGRYVVIGTVGWDREGGRTRMKDSGNSGYTM